GMQCAATPADIPVVDTVGAGDSFTGGIIDALWGLGLVGADAREALRTLDEATAMKILTRASRISDITVSRAGANPPWLSALSASELND
ncbi:UNVERIFIED_CONTAM: carbohydrate kinase, partial [Bacillus sp. ATCC 13368]